MIKYRLICKDCETTFDSWFSSSKEYERLKIKKFLNCHFCNSISVEKALFTLIISGAVGNLYDRVTYFAVPDFVDLHFNNFHWFTFNIADIFITTGIIGLLIRELRKK